jgi:Zn-finger nucleic acid-binding protein
MRSYERNGVTIDQCTNCRGLFLDRGELERLVDAEGAYYEREAAAAGPPRGSAPPPSRERGYDRDRDSDSDRYREPSLRDYFGGHGGGHGGHHGGHRKKRRKSFLDDLFD